YSNGDYDLAGFAVGAAERGNLLPRADVEAGDALIAVASSGAHSNGFSLIRKLVETNGLTWSDPAPFAPGQSLGEALLTPTRIYVQAALTAIREIGAVKALAHITGGGLPENLPRVLPEGLSAHIDLGNLELPAVFGWIAKQGGVAPAELLRTFNCGAGLVIIAPAGDADAVLSSLARSGEIAFPLGEVEAREGTSAMRFTGKLDVAS
ncbi:MAG: phosphoribosylformylglycinamidine cyclo-ligase, partial [Methyloligellaceae bacterium]